MKKIFTILLGLAATSTAMAAVTSAPVERKLLLDAEKKAQLEVAFQQSLATSNDVEVYTRTWNDGKGGTWELQLTYTGLTLLQAFPDWTEIHEMFADGDLFLPRIQLANFNAQNTPTDYIIGFLEWPSMYWYQQRFEYDNYDVPVAERDQNIVPPSVLCNNPNLVSLFTECEYVGFGADTWYMLPTSELGSVLYQGQEAQTVMTDNFGGTFDFRAFDVEEGSIDFVFNFPVQVGARTAKLSGNYTGTAIVKGFEPRYITSPELGSIHLFNGGLISSELVGDENPFGVDFDELTQFFLMAIVDGMDIPANATVGPFNPDKLGFAPTSENSIPEDKDFFYYDGYLFGDPSYAKDINKDPVDQKFTLDEGEWFQIPGTNQGYISVTPAENVFVCAFEDDEWSDIYGMKVACQGMWYNGMCEPSTIEWGTTAGFVANMSNTYSEYLTSFGTKNIIYHYDPTDMSKTREIASVGDREYTAVKGVSVDSDVKVIARDGMINVVAGENAPIAIFTLDGKLVKATKASEVSVEAPKGMYVVRVGNKAKKVVL